MLSSEVSSRAASQIEILLKPSDVNTEAKYYEKLSRRGIEECGHETFSNVCVQRHHHTTAAVANGVISPPPAAAAVANNNNNSSDHSQFAGGNMGGGKNRGKGLYATRDFIVGDRVLIEPPLVAMQHERNRNDAIVCSFCFRYVGSIEKQIGHRLFHQLSSAQAKLQQQN